MKHLRARFRFDAAKNGSRQATMQPRSERSDVSATDVFFFGAEREVLESAFPTLHF